MRMKDGCFRSLRTFCGEVVWLHTEKTADVNRQPNRSYETSREGRFEVCQYKTQQPIRNKRKISFRFFIRQQSVYAQTMYMRFTNPAKDANF